MLRRLLLAACLLVSIAAPGMAQDAPESPRIIRISAERFAFYPSRITIDAGEQVEFRITSDDTNHGFRLIGTATAVIIPKRGKGEARAVVRIDKPGTYRFECHRMCGAGHSFMRGELVVREKPSSSTP